MANLFQIRWSVVQAPGALSFFVNLSSICVAISIILFWIQLCFSVRKIGFASNQLGSHPGSSIGRDTILSKLYNLVQPLFSSQCNGPSKIMSEAVYIPNETMDVVHLAHLAQFLAHGMHRMHLNVCFPFH